MNFQCFLRHCTPAPRYSVDAAVGMGWVSFFPFFFPLSDQTWTILQRDEQRRPNVILCFWLALTAMLASATMLLLSIWAVEISLLLCGVPRAEKKNYVLNSSPTGRGGWKMGTSYRPPLRIQSLHLCVMVQKNIPLPPFFSPPLLRSRKK